MKEVVIVSAARIPVGRFQGALQSFSAPQLGALAVREAVRRAGGISHSAGGILQIDECIMGCVLQAGLGQNPARQAALYGGLSNQVAALTINKVCEPEGRGPGRAGHPDGERGDGGGRRHGVDD
jgi:acetyl-CoA C-acetyltransferase